MYTLQVCWIESSLEKIMIRNQFQIFQLNVNSPHILSNINAMAELSNFTNKRDLQLAKLVHTELSEWLRNEPLLIQSLFTGAPNKNIFQNHLNSIVERILVFKR